MFTAGSFKLLLQTCLGSTEESPRFWWVLLGCRHPDIGGSSLRCQHPDIGGFCADIDPGQSVPGAHAGAESGFEFSNLEPDYQDMLWSTKPQQNLEATLIHCISVGWRGWRGYKCAVARRPLRAGVRWVGATIAHNPTPAAVILHLGKAVVSWQIHRVDVSCEVADTMCG